MPLQAYSEQGRVEGQVKYPWEEREHIIRQRDDTWCADGQGEQEYAQTVQAPGHPDSSPALAPAPAHHWRLSR